MNVGGDLPLVFSRETATFHTSKLQPGRGRVVLEENSHHHWKKMAMTNKQFFFFKESPFTVIYFLLFNLSSFRQFCFSLHLHEVLVNSEQNYDKTARITQTEFMMLINPFSRKNQTQKQPAAAEQFHEETPRSTRRACVRTQRIPQNKRHQGFVLRLRPVKTSSISHIPDED